MLIYENNDFNQLLTFIVKLFVVYHGYIRM